MPGEPGGDVRGPRRVTFVYLGRRGLSRFALDVVRAALADESMAATIVVSRQNESYSSFAELNEAHLPADTFSTDAGAVWRAWRIPLVRRRLEAAIARHQPGVVIELMPHAWSRGARSRDRSRARRLRRRRSRLKC
jgi:hypothetical protein